MLKSFLRAADIIGLLLVMIGLFAKQSMRPGLEKLYWPLIILGVALIIVGVAAKYREILEGLRRRSTLLSVNSFLSILIVLGTLGAVNYLGKNHEQRYDLTKSRVNSLSDQTVTVAKSIKKKLDIKAFYPEAGYRPVHDLLNLYRALNTNIEFELVDPDRQPELAKRYNVTHFGVERNPRTRSEVALGTVVLLYEGREEKIEKRQGELQEEDVTSAMVRVLKPMSKTVYFLTGHGEKRTDSQERNGYSVVKAALENERYTVKPLNLIQEKKIPEDCATLIIAGPTSEPFPDELKLIADYLNGGGGVLVLLDSPMDSPPGVSLAGFLKQWSVDVGDNVVVDPSSRLLGASPAIPIVSQYGQHRITQRFDMMTFYPLARSVAPAGDSKNPDLHVETLMESSPNSWAEVDYRDPQIRFDEGKDKKGPISLGVAVSQDLPPPTPDKKDATPRSMRLVAIGDSDFATNSNFRQAGNSNLFMNCISWLAQDESFISIRAKSPEDRRTSFTQAQGVMLRLFSMILLPLGILAVGIAVWARRRG